MMKRVEKTIGFLDRMIRVVFISTFIYTVVMTFLAYYMSWESLAIVLTERWFNVMIGELLVMGLIQIVKEYVSSKIRVAEIESLETKEEE